MKEREFHHGEIHVSKRHLTKVEVVNASISGLLLGLGLTSSLMGEGSLAVQYYLYSAMSSAPFVGYQVFGAGRKKTHDNNKE